MNFIDIIAIIGTNSDWSERSPPGVKELSLTWNWRTPQALEQSR